MGGERGEWKGEARRERRGAREGKGREGRGGAKREEREEGSKSDVRGEKGGRQGDMRGERWGEVMRAIDAAGLMAARKTGGGGEGGCWGARDVPCVFFKGRE